MPSAEQAPEATDGGDYLEETLDVLADELWERIEKRYAPLEFERGPVRRLLAAIFGEGSVEHTGGPRERGADFICTREGPLGTPHTTAVQVKMWEGDLNAAALGQLERAHAEWPLITSGVVLTTAEREPADVAAARYKLEKELDIPIRVVLRRELLELLLRHLPDLAGIPAE